MSKKIDFRKMKYWLPAVCYPFLLLLGWLVIDTFNIQLSDKTDRSLIAKNEYNAELPAAQVGDEFGDKLDNMRRQYGAIKEESPMSGIESDKDTIRQKLGYERSLTDEELEAVREKNRADSLEALLQEQQRRMQRLQGRDQSGEEFTRRLSPEDRKRVEKLRSRGVNLEQMERDLGISLDSAVLGGLIKGLSDSLDHVPVASSGSTSGSSATGSTNGSDSVRTRSSARNKPVRMKAVVKLDDDVEEESVMKKVTETSRHFNTISANVDESNMIKAIIDENIKVVDGSRVRLRLLDDVEVDHVLLRKGSYLYAEMSGFSKQRIKGKISSVMVGDELVKCNLSVYDMDGLEGLYIPSSSFRETAKDVGGNVFSSGSMNVSGSMNAESTVAQFASQALQNAYQKTSQAIGKAIKKNRVRLKYGTHVFLINGNKKQAKGNVPSSAPASRDASRRVSSGAGLRSTNR